MSYTKTVHHLPAEAAFCISVENIRSWAALSCRWSTTIVTIRGLLSLFSTCRYDLMTSEALVTAKGASRVSLYHPSLVKLWLCYVSQPATLTVTLTACLVGTLYAGSHRCPGIRYTALGRRLMMPRMMKCNTLPCFSPAGASCPDLDNRKARVRNWVMNHQSRQDANSGPWIWRVMIGVWLGILLACYLSYRTSLGKGATWTLLSNSAQIIY